MKLYFSLLTTLLSIIFFSACSNRPLHMYTLNIEENIPKTSPHFDSIRVDYPKGIEETMGTKIYFSRSNLTQSYYSYSQWSKSLNRILMANLIKALLKSNISKNVLDYASQAEAKYELESTIYSFEHKIEDKGSFANISIGMRLLRTQDHYLISSKIFNYKIPCETTDAKGFVEASNKALSHLSIDTIKWLKNQ